MRIDAIRRDAAADGVTVSAAFDGDRVSWHLPPGAPEEARGELFAITGLMPAMQRGTPLALPAGWPIDPRVRDGLEEVQRIWRLWYPGLTVVPVECDVAPWRRAPTGRGAGFSGGVDSSYTVARLATDLDALVFIDGIDAKHDNRALMDDVAEGHRDTAAALGLGFLRVRTDVKRFTNAHRLSWTVAHGAMICAIPHALGLASYAIAGSNSWENLRPLGSHPVTDPLFGGDAVRILHHGTDVHRQEKVRALADHPLLRDRLRVCLEGTDYNCGACAKCLMTAAAFRAAGLRSAALPPLDDPTRLRTMHVHGDGDLVDWEEIREPGLEGRDPALARELRRLVRRYEWRRLGHAAERVMLGGGMKRALRRLGLLRPEHRPIG